MYCSKVYAWHSFLLKEIEAKRLPVKTMRPNAHYLGHIPYMIRAQGPLAAYSARSMERAIGRYKRLITARTNVGVNAGNIIDRLAISKAIKTSASGAHGEDDDADQDNADLDVHINLLTPRRYDAGTYVNLRNDDGKGSQLWYPVLHTTITAIPSSLNIDKVKFVKAIQNFYSRQYSSDLLQGLVLDDELDIVVSGSAWAYNYTYRSEYYRHITGANSRGSHYVMVFAEYLRYVISTQSLFSSHL